MEEQIPRTPLVVKGDWDSEWSVEVQGIEELKRLLGLPLLVEFCRCSVAADRLVSCGDFTLFNDEWKPRLPIAHSRNLLTMFWVVWGTLYEAIDSLTEMETLGIEGLLGSFEARKPWLELRSMAKHWTEDPVYQRVRDKVAFHLDASTIRKGVNKAADQGSPVVWKTGNTTKDRSSVFRFAEDSLLSVLFPDELDDEEARKRFADLSRRVRDVHLGFSGWTQELFVGAIRGASAGLKLTPKEAGAVSGEVAEERLTDIAELAEQTPRGEVQDALHALLGEVRRLKSTTKRLGNDPDAANARRRKEGEDRRLRAIAATAKEFLASRAPAAEQRLRELLQHDLGAGGREDLR